MPIFSPLDRLRKHLELQHGTELSPSSFSYELPPQGMRGDITLNCYKLSKILKLKPEEIAEKINSFLVADPDVLYSENLKGFVNLELSPSSVHQILLDDSNRLLNSALLPEESRRVYLIEYSAPNTNKPMHLGHVRNNCLGLAISSILKNVGHKVYTVNLINDRGIHICKSMIAYQRYGNGSTPETTGLKGDHFVGNYYVKFDQELRKQLDSIKQEKPELRKKKDDDLFLETEIGRAAQKMLVDWEKGDTEIISLWKKMNEWVISGFDQTYNRMGISFDRVYFESQTYLLGKDIILDGLQKGIFEKSEDGAVFVDLEKENFAKKVLLRSDGTSVYITQDIGTTIRKAEDFSPFAQIWIVGDEQILHFKILFAILKKLGYKWAENLYHLPYGMVNLPSGKMKSREGTVVDADDLFDQMNALAHEAVTTRYGDKLPTDLDQRCETIGMGALKFMLLKYNPKTTMMFDPDASIKFEGDTGPYVQYACARINSISRKATELNISCSDTVNYELLASKEEKGLSARAVLYPRVLREAADKIDSSIITNYLLDLAKCFNRFYNEYSVLNAENCEIRKARIRLCLAIMDILKHGLATLSIKVPEAM